MKYLKKYNSHLNESKLYLKDISDTIDDICIELKDVGFVISNSIELHEKLFITKIGNISFSLNEILEVIIRINKYLENNNLYIDYLYLRNKNLRASGYESLNDLIKKIDPNEADLDSLTIVINKLENKSISESKSDSINYTEILDTIKDICVDLEDIGYIIFTNSDIRAVQIERDYKFNSDEVLDTLIRVKEYVESEGFYLSNIYVITDSKKVYKLQNINSNTFSFNNIRMINFNIIKKNNVTK